MDPGPCRDDDGQDNRPLNRHPEESQDPVSFVVMPLALIDYQVSHGLWLSPE